MSAANRICRSKLTLAATQAMFQAAILDGKTGILELLCDNSKTTRDTLFDVYRHGYAARLVQILATDYEKVAQYLGESAFDAAARGYILANPSRSQNARWFGHGFPEFLRTFEPTAGRAEVADLANLERTLAIAFDAADCEPLTLAGLAAFPPENWGNLKFAPHPSATLIACTTDAFGLWKSIVDGQPAPPGVATSQQLIVWREGTIPRVRQMIDEEAMMWAEACRSVRFSALCEMLATFDRPDAAPLRAASYLQGWLSTGLLASVALS